MTFVFTLCLVAFMATHEAAAGGVLEPDVTATCYMTIQGADGSVEPYLECDGAEDVLVSLGAQLQPFGDSYYGVHVVSGPAWDRPFTPDDDWGVTFHNVTHLLLRDSVVTGVPLTSAAPLVHCRGCTFVSLANVDISDLAGMPAGSSGSEPPSYIVHGPMHLEGVVSVSVDGLTCYGNKQAHGWSCLLVTYAVGGADSSAGASSSNNGSAVASGLLARSLSLSNSVVSSNEVVWSGVAGMVPPDQESQGYGAIVLRLEGDTAGAGATGASTSEPGAAVSVTLQDCSLLDNSGGYGALMAILPGLTLDTLSMTRSNVNFNRASTSGGCLHVAGEAIVGQISLNGTHLLGNTAAAGHGGCFALPQSSLNNFIIANESTVLDNTAATGAGGCLYVGGASGVAGVVSVQGGSNVTGNSAFLEGGCVAVVQGGVGGVDVTGASHVLFNAAGGSGGFLNVGDGAVGNITITGGSVVSGNRAAVADQSGVGGFVATTTDSAGSTTEVAVNGASNVTANSAAYGGWLALGRVGRVRLSGGALLSGNRATQSGAGLYVASLDELRVEGAVVADNVAGTAGGVVSAEQGLGNITITQRAVVSWNQASALAGGVVSANGECGSLLIANGSAVVGNSAGTTGGVLSADSLASLTVDNATVASNSARLGGVVHTGVGLGSLLIMHGSDVFNNSASSPVRSTSEGFGGVAHAYGAIEELAVLGGSRVHANSASASGGVAAAFGGITAFRLLGGSAVEANTAGSHGGALFGGTGATNSIVIDGLNTSLSSCSAGGSGGALYIGALGNLTVSGWARIAGNTARNGSGGALSARQAKGAILLGSGCALNDNSALLGGGGALAFADDVVGMLLQGDVDVHGNSAERGNGGAILVEGSLGSITLGDNSAATGNTAKNGGFLAVMRGLGTLLVSGSSSISRNTADLSSGAGGAVLVGPGPAGDDGVSGIVLQSGAQVDGNQAAMGGGIYINGSLASLALSGNTSLSGNTAMQAGGGVTIIGALGELRVSAWSAVSGNQAGAGGGGAVRCGGDLGAVRLEGGAELQGNAASGPGGALFVGGSVLEVAMTGGAVAAGNKGSYGGVMAVAGLVGDVGMAGSGTAMTNNSAAAGGGCIWAGAGLSTLTLQAAASLCNNTAASGGAVHVDTGDISSMQLVTGSSAADNTATAAHGGLLCVAAGSLGLLRLDGARMARNRAAGSGGAVYAAGGVSQVTLTGNCEVVGHTASVDGGFLAGPAANGISSSGGGGDDTTLQISISACHLVDNAAISGSGGFLHTGLRVGSATLSNAIITGNSAGTDGGVLNLQSGVATFLMGPAVSVSACTAGRDGGFAAVAVPPVSAVGPAGGAATMGGGSAGRLSLLAGSTVSRCNAGRSGGAVAVGGPVGQLSIAGGSAITACTAGQDGGAISSGGSVASLTVSGPGSALRNNSALAGSGGAISAAGFTAVVHIADGGAIAGNTAGANGGGVWSRGPLASLLLQDGGMLANNSAGESGGGVACSDDLTQVVLNDTSSLSGNTAGRQGGGLWVAGGVDSLDIDGGSRLNRNTAQGGAGGGLWAAGRLGPVAVLGASQISGNTAKDSGGGIAAGTGIESITLDGGSSASGNSAAGSGGALACVGSSSSSASSLCDVGAVTLTGASRMDGNSAGEAGGAVAAARVGTLHVLGGSSVSGNVAESDGGAVACNTLGDALVAGRGSTMSGNIATSGSGGALRCAAVTNLTLADGASFFYNSAADSGGVLAADTLSTMALLRRANTSGNTARRHDGGCFYARVLGSLTMQVSDALANTAGRHGGWMMVQLPPAPGATWQLSGGVLERNEAQGGAGGALAVMRLGASTAQPPSADPLTASGSISLSGMALTGNRAAGDGGALALQVVLALSLPALLPSGKGQMGPSDAGSSYLRVEMHNCTLSSNRAGGAGGAMQLTASTSKAAAAVQTAAQPAAQLQLLATPVMRLLIENSQLTGNIAGSSQDASAAGAAANNGLGSGGAVSIVHVPSADLLTDATAGASSLAVATASGCSLQVTHSQFHSNAAAGGRGGAVAAAACRLAMDTSFLDGNTAASNGGAVAVSDTAGITPLLPDGRPLLQVSGTTFDANTAAIGGGAVDVDVPGAVPADATASAASGEGQSGLASNKPFSPAAIAAWAAGRVASQVHISVIITSSNFTSNAATPPAASGGATITASGMLRGGSLSLTGPGTNARLEGTRVSDSSAGTAASSSAAAAPTAQALGGGIFLQGGASLALAARSIVENCTSADGGGGIYADGCPLLALLGSSVSGSVAVRGPGGAVYAQGCGAVVVQASNLTGCAAAAGGAVAADGVEWVMLMDAKLEGNKAQGSVSTDAVGAGAGNSGLAGGSGGALAVSGGHRLIVISSSVVSNEASTGGGVHFSATDGDSSGNTSDATSGLLAVLHDVALADNRAVSLAALPGGGRFAGYGGGAFVDGRVALVFSESDVAEGNDADVGGAVVATTQVCNLLAGIPQPQQDDAYSAGASLAQLATLLQATGVLAPVDHQPLLLAAIGWNRTWTALERDAAGRCWPLGLANTRIVPASAASATAGLPSVTAGRRRGAQATTKQPATALWFLEPYASALRVKCRAQPAASSLSPQEAQDAADAFAAATIASSDLLLTDATSAASTTSQPAAGQGGQQGQGQLLAQATGAALAACIALQAPELLAGSGSNLGGPGGGLSALHLLVSLPPSTLSLSALTLPSGENLAPAYTQQLQAWEQRQLQQSAPAASSAAASGALVGGRRRRHRQLQQAADPVSAPALELPAGQPLAMEVLLLNSGGQLVVDHVPVSVAVSVSPPHQALLQQPGDGGGGNPLAVALGGAARWEALLLRAWPGLYNLTFETTRDADSPYKIEPLVVPVHVLPCAPGEALDASASGLQPSWTACRQCPVHTVGLWRDPRGAPLEPMAGVTPGANAMDAALLPGPEAVTARLVVQMERDSACTACPEHAMCPGGAVVVPEEGYWHSSPNSTIILQCFELAACTRDAKSRIQAAAMDAAAAPTPVLVACQQAWYASRPPGAAVLRSYTGLVASRLALLPGNTSSSSSSSESSITDDIDSGTGNRNGRTAAAATAADGACLLWDVPEGDPWVGYMARQCGEGYAGNLCATCTPGRSLDSDFVCEECGSVGRNVALGVVGFLITVAVMLCLMASLVRDSTAEAAGSQAQAPEQQSTLCTTHVLKVAVQHIQYFIIITTLVLSWPRAVQRLQNALAAATSAERFFNFAAPCLFPDADDQGSGDQAQAALAAALIVPCCAFALSLALRWLWCFVHQRQATRNMHAEAEGAGAGSMATVRKASASSAAMAANSSAQLPPRPRRRRSTSTGGGRPGGRSGSTSLGGSDGGGLALSFSGAGPVAEALLEGGPVPVFSINASANVVEPTPRYPYAASLREQQQQRVTGTLLGGSERSSGSFGTGSSRASHSAEPSGDMADTKKLAPAALATASVAANASGAAPVPVPAWSMRQQLGAAALAGAWVVYPSLAQAALSVFACYRLDDDAPGGSGQADWHAGYWLRDMEQRCYAGTHLSVYLPVGVVAVALFCAAPPLVWAVLLWRWRARGALSAEPAVRQLYGTFMFGQYRESFYWCGVAQQVQTLGLVCTAVFSRTLPPQHQAVVMMGVLLLLALGALALRPARCVRLLALDLGSLCVLVLTLALGLWVGGGPYQEHSSSADATISGLVIAANSALVLLYAALAARAARNPAPAVSHVPALATVTPPAALSAENSALLDLPPPKPEPATLSGAHAAAAPAAATNVAAGPGRGAAKVAALGLLVRGLRSWRRRNSVAAAAMDVEEHPASAAVAAPAPVLSVSAAAAPAAAAVVHAAEAPVLRTAPPVPTPAPGPAVSAGGGSDGGAVVMLGSHGGAWSSGGAGDISAGGAGGTVQGTGHQQWQGMGMAIPGQLLEDHDRPKVATALEGDVGTPVGAAGSPHLQPAFAAGDFLAGPAVPTNRYSPTRAASQRINASDSFQGHVSASSLMAARAGEAQVRMMFASSSGALQLQQRRAITGLPSIGGGGGGGGLGRAPVQRTVSEGRAAGIGAGAGSGAAAAAPAMTISMNGSMPRAGASQLPIYGGSGNGQGLGLNASLGRAQMQRTGISEGWAAGAGRASSASGAAASGSTAAGGVEAVPAPAPAVMTHSGDGTSAGTSAARTTVPQLPPLRGMRSRLPAPPA